MGIFFSYLPVWGFFLISSGSGGRAGPKVGGSIAGSSSVHDKVSLGRILTQAAVCASITETEVRVCAVGAQVEEKSAHLKNIH